MVKKLVSWVGSFFKVEEVPKYFRGKK